MKNINIPMLLVAMLVILMFAAAGVSIAFRNGWLIVLFLVLGCCVMGFGLASKRKKSDSH